MDLKEKYKKAQEELAEAKLQLTEFADKAEEFVEEDIPGFLKKNGKLIGIAFAALSIGFALGAALV